jgi:indole-3-glycerol phosphate synthase
MVVTYLDRIAAWHREAAAADGRDGDELAARAFATPRTRDFAEAIRTGPVAAQGPPIALIAEIKRRSPSKGDLAPKLDPVEVAHAYESGGASCLSVLTDAPHFGGSADDLMAARAAVRLPVLRKDFTVSANDVYDSRIMGDDALLLIVAILDQDELGGLHGLAVDLGLSVLVEVHDEDELARALDVGAQIVGVNQRDLHTFEVERDRASRVVGRIPDGILKVAESGVESGRDVSSLARAGFDAVLVGEALLRSSDRSAAAGELLGRTVPCG